MTAIATTEVEMKTLAAQMLRENTGSNIIDSGSAYGRGWERNAATDFEAEPATRVRFEFNNGKLQGYVGTINLYHWLTLNFEPDSEMQERIDRDAEENPKDRWFHVAARVAEQVSTEYRPSYTYTYNQPDNWDLSQDVQFWQVYTEDEYEPSHLIVMVHNGCDARWGFTKPYALRITSDSSAWRESGHIDCIRAGDYSWHSDGGYGAAFNCEHPDVLDFFTLPFADETCLGDEQDEFEALIKRQHAAISETTLSPDKQEAARAVLDESLQESRNRRVLEKLGDDVDIALVRKGDKLVAIVEGFENDVTVGNLWF
jgi:hypothetical protein